MLDYKGAIHIHTKHSDGSGSIHGIAQIANQAELDYLIITDHNRCHARFYEGWSGKTLVLIGQEVSPPGNHLIVMGCNRTIFPRRGDPQGLINEIKKEGGLSFIAHPHNRPHPLLFLGNHSWRNWDVNGYTGLELWSYMADWVEKATPLNLFSYLRHPDQAITGPNIKTLEKWDELLRQKKVPVIGSLDAHAKPFLFREVFPYRQLLKTIRTHILLPDPFESDVSLARQAVYEALANGHAYIANDSLADASGFLFEAESAGKRAIMGDSLDQPPAQVSVSSPHEAKLKLIKEGAIVKEVEGRSLQAEVFEKEAYRVEAYYQGRPWVFTNPIYVGR
ncbi:MAG: CehA/McbA family metallohydrolase [bacterium]|nr:CehA/McbA family metallohydrolase [bacterium]